MRFDSRQQYTDVTEAAWTKLWRITEELSDAQLTQRVQLNSGPARSPKDALAHLYAWHKLLLQWCRSGAHGTPELPAPGYNWRQTRDLNAVLHDEHADADYPQVRRRLKLSHRRVERIVESLTDDQLLVPGNFTWTGRLPLISYIAPNTVSHYRWAAKRIRALTKSA